MSQEQRPSFKSSIPTHLLTNCTDQEKWLMETVDILKQATEHTLDKQYEQSAELAKQNLELAEIKKQTTATNGRVNKHDQQIGVFEEIAQDLKDIVGTKRVVEKAVASKWFYIFIGIFIIGVTALVKSPTLQDWFLKIFGA